MVYSKWYVIEKSWALSRTSSMAIGVTDMSISWNNVKTLHTQKYLSFTKVKIGHSRVWKGDVWLKTNQSKQTSIINQAKSIT